MLQQRLWPDTFVAEANLSNLVAEIRAALGDQARAPLFIRTVHGFGYAFCGDATTCRALGRHGRIDRRAGSSGAAAVSAVRRGPCHRPRSRRRSQARRVDRSRRHARLVVTADGTVLEDFGSKNGTFRGNERVTSPIQLVDGDAIRIGSLLVTFHVPRRTDSTETQCSRRCDPQASHVLADRDRDRSL